MTHNTTQERPTTGLRAFVNGSITGELRELHGEITTDLDALDAGASRLERLCEQLASGQGDIIHAAIIEALSADEELKREVKKSTEPGQIPDVVHSHYSVLDAVSEARIPAWLYGEAGSGKSTAAETVADVRRLDFRSISLCPTTSKSDILGYRDATGQYRSSGFRDVYQDGGVFLFDEIDNSHPSSLALINHALANGSTEFPDGYVEQHPDAIIIAGANTIGRGANAQYVGRSVIDGATRDRFAFIPWDIDDDLEESLVMGQDLDDGVVDISTGGIPSPSEWLTTVRGYRRAIEASGVKHICSTRATLYGAQLAKLGMGRDWLTEILVYKGMSEADKRKIEAHL
ncbi:AAA family ATPase [Candidatus Saccharibacteria bacterium]|nr:AAA family ATPase [Candidatus Saccharibacteria bacterium]